MPHSAMVCVLRETFWTLVRCSRYWRHLFFGELIRRSAVVARELCDRVNVGLHGTLGVAAQLQFLDHASAELGHEILSVKGMRGS